MGAGKHNRWLGIVMGTLALALCQSAFALTAQEIADSVIDELDNVTDYTASVDVDWDDAGTSDMSDGCLQWKRNSGLWMSKMVMGPPYAGEVRTDGSTGFNVWDRYNQLSYCSVSEGEEFVRSYWGVDMFNMERILAQESWSKDSGTETVNSVTCYRLYSTDYEVWIDTATVTRVIRVKAYDSSANLDYQLDYSDYSDVESTAQLPATIYVQKYDDEEELECAGTYCLSDVDINEGLNASLFDIESPD